MTCVLVISPHPDDEILGCGGSICARSSDGHSIKVAYLSSGEQGSPVDVPTRVAPMREQEAIRALQCLGLTPSDAIFLGFPDGEIDEGNTNQFVSLMCLIRSLRPAVMYIPHCMEASKDHREASKLAIRAADMAQSRNYRPTAAEQSWRIPIILAYEVWTPLTSFQYLESIDPYVDRKLQALECYRSQSQETKGQATYIGPGGLALSGYRGAMALGGHAEVFQVIRGDTIFRGVDCCGPRKALGRADVL
jgi:LmbE family N-acetylglucosaminyl deacetylase